MARHELKSWPIYFQPLIDGTKSFEVRINDRKFNIDDIVELQEWEPYTGNYTGRYTLRRVTYLLRGGLLGIDERYVIMSLEKVAP